MLQLDKQTDVPYQKLVVRIKHYKQTNATLQKLVVTIKRYKQKDRPFKEVINFCDTHFFVIHRGSQLTF